MMSKGKARRKVCNSLRRLQRDHSVEISTLLNELDQGRTVVPALEGLARFAWRYAEVFGSDFYKRSCYALRDAYHYELREDWA